MSQEYRFVSKVENIPLEIGYNHLFRLENEFIAIDPTLKERLLQIKLGVVNDSPFPRDRLYDVTQWSWQADMTSSTRAVMLTRLFKIEVGFVEFGRRHVSNFEEVVRCVQTQTDAELETVKIFRELDALIASYQRAIGTGEKLPAVTDHVAEMKKFLNSVVLGKIS